MSEPAPAEPRPPVPVAADDPRIEALQALIGTVDRLRDPDGCPWDRSQTLASFTPHLVEEAHELVDAVEREDDEGACEELGDLLMGVLLAARIARDDGRFDLDESAERTVEKLVRRHPHVFGPTGAKDAEEALASWEEVKRAEREEQGADASALAGIPVALPALQRARRTCEKAVAAGFRWRSAAGALEKVREEVCELEELLGGGPLEPDAAGALPPDLAARVEEELGDVLLAGAFLGAYLGLDPERALRASLRRFEDRFRRMEAACGGVLRDRSLDELLARWREAKAAEAGERAEERDGAEGRGAAR